MDQLYNYQNKNKGFIFYNFLIVINGMIGKFKHNNGWNQIEGTNTKVNGFKDGKVQIYADGTQSGDNEGTE